MRPDDGWRVTPAWLAAIFRGQDRVARGLGIEAPVLVLLSARSTAPVRWSEAMRTSDTVVDVVGIARRIPALGSVVTLARIEGGLHDVTLSAPEVRDVVWRETARWFHGYVGLRPEPGPEAGSDSVPRWLAAVRRWFTGSGPSPAPDPSRS
jgi:alpha-beta hydrolase superfamily lysophospholipase